MARSPNDDPVFSDMHAWSFRETGEGCPGAPTERKQPPVPPNATLITDNSMYTSYGPDVYMNKVTYNVQAGDTAANNDDKAFNNMPRAPRQNYGNAMLNLGNGQLVRVFYDENNQQLIFPMNSSVSQYELFNNNQGLRDMPLQTSQPSHMFTLNQNTKNNVHIAPNTVQNNNYNQESGQNVQTSNFLKEVLGNWEPNSTGTYSPFGQNYPLNHPDAPTMNVLPNNPVMDQNPINQVIKTENSPKRNENSPLADTSNKKRIVAEVKPMRPSYSDVLAKNAKNNSPNEPTRKAKPQNMDAKPNKINTKPEKATANTKHDDNKHKHEKKLHTNTISSGSESGDINTDDMEKHQKPSKKSKNKRSNISRKWSSLDDIANEDDLSYKSNESQFVFIENNAEKPSKKERKSDHKCKHNEKHSAAENSFRMNEEDDNSQFAFQDGQSETKSKRKKEPRIYKTPKPSQDKKKGGQTKLRRNKPGYLGLAQNYLEHWGGATWKAVVWFLYLLSDICGMSANLLFDLCTSMFTQTYVSSQAVWRSTKDYFSKVGHNNKYLQYIDRKLGHTRFGFWRKIKWFKKEKEAENDNDSAKLNANIPLPATGDEAMKRLLACKGKDPYSILGVSVSCTDEEIKRYYRRQAFLVHPDKNQQPGAEEAFKILQHAFDLIGEPERREAYDRRAVESRHVEAAWSELSQLLTQLHDKMEFAANTIRCTNCGRRHKRVLTDRPCYAARYCAQCKIRHSAKEGDIWAESSMLGLLVMYYACMDGAVYQITQWASCQKKNLKQLRPDCHVVQYRIVLGNNGSDVNHRPSTGQQKILFTALNNKNPVSQKSANAAMDSDILQQQPNDKNLVSQNSASAATDMNHLHDPNLEEFLNNLYSKSGAPPPDDGRRRRAKKPKP